MLQQVLEKKNDINEIVFKNYGKEWRIFGEVIGFKGFSEIDFLITPGEFMHEQKWNKVRNDLSSLFPNHYVRCFTRDILKSMAKMRELSIETVAEINATAKNSDELEKLVE